MQFAYPGFNAGSYVGANQPIYWEQSIQYSFSSPESGLEMMSRQFLLEGEITFEEAGASLEGATAYIRLEDASQADAASRIIAEQVVQDISHETGSKDKLRISLHGQIPNEKASYIVSVHIDVDGDGQISQGDYINMESYPVLTFGHSNQVSVCVRQVK